MDQDNGSTVAIKTLDLADLGASKPVPQPPQPKSQPVQHPTVRACGHKLDIRHFPTQANCFDCWLAFFESNAEGLAAVHQMLMEGGTQAIESRFGKKFVRMFGAYLRKKLLLQVNAQAQAESGMEVPNISEEANLGVR